MNKVLHSFIININITNIIIIISPLFIIIIIIITKNAKLQNDTCEAFGKTKFGVGSGRFVERLRGS